MKSIIPVVMAGIIAIYGLVVAVLITNGLKPVGYTLMEPKDNTKANPKDRLVSTVLKVNTKAKHKVKLEDTE